MQWRISIRSTLGLIHTTNIAHVFPYIVMHSQMWIQILFILERFVTQRTLCWPMIIVVLHVIIVVRFFVERFRAMRTTERWQTLMNATHVCLIDFSMQKALCAFRTFEWVFAFLCTADGWRGCPPLLVFRFGLHSHRWLCWDLNWLWQSRLN